MNYDEVKVLICDDSILVRKNMKDLMKDLGVKDVFEAKDGVEGVEKYKEIQPDVVFMDIVMPNKDGIQALKEIMEFSKAARVVMATSVGTKGRLKEAVELGAYEFLQKPFENNQVQDLMKKIFEGEM